MTILKHLVLTFTLTLCAACWSIAWAQMPPLDVAIDTNQVRFAATGQEMRVEVYAPSGEMVFDSGAVTNQAIEWKMQNAKGERVVEGVYLVTISMKTATGQVRKRIEQVVVGREQQGSASTSSPSATPTPITGTGTSGRIVKFTGAATIGNSAMFEMFGRIGIGTTTPTSLLHVKSAGGVTAIIGNNTGTGIGITGLSVSNYGVSGKSSTGIGVRGETGGGDSVAGVYGISTGFNGIGLWGQASGGGSGVFGSSSSGYGVSGFSSSGDGVRGSSSSGNGVYGVSNNNFGVYGASSDSFGVYGTSTSNDGVHGNSFHTYGVYGQHYGNDSNGAGVFGIDFGNKGTGVIGQTVTGATSIGVWGISSSGQAGHFDGNVDIVGSITKTSGSFKIDHPLDPAHRYLYHSFVESPDMMNIYNGNITTDENGDATITLPRYFQALNRDFRYQLTVIGGEFAQAIVSSKIKGNRFQIKTDKPNVEVSWQVTGVRKDAWAEAHRIPVEEEKPEREQGFYLHPELFNQPEEKGIDWALRPEAMRQLKERAAQPPPSSDKQ